MSRLSAISSASALVAAFVVLAPPASADSASYLQELDARGIKYTDDAMDAMVNIGVLACNDIRGGASLPEAGANTANRGIGIEKSLLLVLIATKNLCPEFFPQTFRTALDNNWICSDGLGSTEGPECSRSE